MRGGGGRISLGEGGSGVYSWCFVCWLSFAVIESGVERSWDREATAQDVVDVLTVSRGIRSIHTSPNTEVVGRHEARPLVSLLIVSESIGEYQTTFGVSKTSPRVRIKFTTVIVRYQTHLCQVP